MLTPEDAHVDPRVMVLDLAARAEARGAQLHAETEVLALETSGRRVTRVTTTRGVFVAHWVVLAAGAWSPRLATGLGIDLPVQPAKGYSVSVARPVGYPELPLYLGERSICVTPMGETVRLAGTLELAGFDMRIRPRRVRGSIEGAAEVLGDMAREEPRLVWRGLRPLSADGLPLIGRSRLYDNLVVATGHCMDGLSLGPATGRLVAQLVTGERPDVDPAPFSPTRFRGV